VTLPPPHLSLAPDLCDGCGRCVRACPQGLVKVGSGYIYVDTSACSGCMLCADVCERDAISRRVVPVRPTATRVLRPGDVPKVVVGSRAEAKALRKAAEQAERDRAAALKGSAKHAKALRASEERTALVANDDTAQWTLADAAVVLAVLAVGVVAKEAALASRVITVVPAAGQSGARAVVLGCFYAMQLVSLIFLSRRHGATLVGAFGLGRLGRSAAHRAWSAALVIGLLVATRLVGLMWGAATQAAGWHPPAKEQLTAVFGAGGGGLALAVIMVVVVGPVVEELLFRGVVLTSGGARWGMWPSILGSSALFALAHGTVWALAPTFALGVALGWLTWTRGSLWPAITLHALYNAVVVGAAFWLVR